YNRWTVNCTLFAPAWGLWLGGSRFDSKIYSISPTYHTDDGIEIRLRRLTGHLGFGAGGRKRSLGDLTLRLKRGEGGTGTPKLMVRWNDDNKRWSNIREVILGDS